MAQTAPDPPQQSFEERLLANHHKRKQAGIKTSDRSELPQLSTGVPGTGGAGAGAVQPGDLEARVQFLEVTNAILIGAVAITAGLSLLRKHRQMAVKTLVAERILLSAPASSVPAAAGASGAGGGSVVVSELGVRAGRPELRMLMGRVVLMDEARNTRMQLDPRFTPAPRVGAPPPSQTTDPAVAGMERLKPWAGQPVLLVNAAGEVPTGVFDGTGHTYVNPTTVAVEVDPATGALLQEEEGGNAADAPPTPEPR